MKNQKGKSIYRMVVVDMENHPKEDEFTSKLEMILSQTSYDEFVGVQGETDIIFTFFNEILVKNLKDLCESYGFLLEFSDVTQEALLGKMSPEDYAIFQNDERHREILENFLRENLTVDMVLDKILEKGKDSLTHIDKEILERGY